MKNGKLCIGFIAALALVLAYVACDNNPSGEGHNHDWVLVEDTRATCVSEGINKYVCSLDSSHIDIRYTDINPDNHNPDHISNKNISYPATCSTAGSGYGKCEDCNTPSVSFTIPINPTAHEWYDEQRTVEVSSWQNGYTATVCINNSEHLKNVSNLQWALGSDNLEYELINGNEYRVKLKGYQYNSYIYIYLPIIERVREARIIL